MDYDAKEEANLKLVRDVYEHVLKPLDSTRVDEFFAPDYIQHNPTIETGAQGIKKFLDYARSVAPEAKQNVKRMFADGDHVIVQMHVIVNPGERGRAVIDIFRIEDGRVAEHWDVAQEIPADSSNTNTMF